MKLQILSLLSFALGAFSLFSGGYSDPHHPLCSRVITHETLTSALVKGADAGEGKGPSCDGKTDVEWGPLPSTISGTSIIVDFSSKGGPSNLSGTFVQDSIHWEDGNVWTKISGQKNHHLRPESQKL